MAVTQLVQNQAIVTIDQANILGALGLPANAVVTSAEWNANTKQLTVVASQLVSGPTITNPN